MSGNGVIGLNPIEINAKVLNAIKENDLDVSLMLEHLNTFKLSIKNTKNKCGFSIGNNGRIRIRNRFVGINYYQFLMFLKHPEFYELIPNKNGNLNLFLKKGYSVHHIDGNKTNDKISNLILLTDEQHKKADNQLWKLNNRKITVKEYKEFLNSLSF